jgi:hypothetical protein
MSTRIHLVLGEEEKALLEEEARRKGMTLSAWLREAAAEKLQSADPPSLSTVAELEAFFLTCDRKEAGREPSWGAHLQVMDESRRRGGSSS